MTDLRMSLLAALVGVMPFQVLAAPLSADAPGAKQEAERLDKLPPLPPAPAGHIDHSGRKEKGRASYYAKRFAHRKMADGRRMNPNSNVAASKTLPLGTVAKVTNLNTGKTETVNIQDRGPYVAGRIVDLSPKVADQLDLKEKGVAPVEVKPITLPQSNGEVKLGAGAAQSNPEEVKRAVEVSKALTAPKANRIAEEKEAAAQR
jgi:rare lipoprotein A